MLQSDVPSALAVRVVSDGQVVGGLGQDYLFLANRPMHGLREVLDSHRVCPIFF